MKSLVKERSTPFLEHMDEITNYTYCHKVLDILPTLVFIYFLLLIFKYMYICAHTHIYVQTNHFYNMNNQVTLQDHIKSVGLFLINIVIASNTKLVSALPRSRQGFYY